MEQYIIKKKINYIILIYKQYIFIFRFYILFVYFLIQTNPDFISANNKSKYKKMRAA